MELIENVPEDVVQFVDRLEDGQVTEEEVSARFPAKNKIAVFRALQKGVMLSREERIFIALFMFNYIQLDSLEQEVSFRLDQTQEEVDDMLFIESVMFVIEADLKTWKVVRKRKKRPIKR
eukprot:TRINITY_DN15085_c0_g1_i1.p2 TRINITY_DN15085_c0_g1~~TRINITY_DN15085_c0_g1_i1.p2  ORF type:complete len:120 (+),score=48.28 TRINITY_DN15085_c0_g1_i1:18-377(+)